MTISLETFDKFLGQGRNPTRDEYAHAITECINACVHDLRLEFIERLNIATEQMMAFVDTEIGTKVQKERQLLAFDIALKSIQNFDEQSDVAIRAQNVILTILTALEEETAHALKSGLAEDSEAPAHEGPPPGYAPGDDSQDARASQGSLSE